MSAMDFLEQQRLEALRIMLSCATQYFCASGLVPIVGDDRDGYGPLRECRLFVEKYGSDSDRKVIEDWKRR